MFCVFSLHFHSARYYLLIDHQLRPLVHSKIRLSVPNLENTDVPLAKYSWCALKTKDHFFLGQICDDIVKL